MLADIGADAARREKPGANINIRSGRAELLHKRQLQVAYVALASWNVASARLSAAAACTFCPTMITLSRTSWRNVWATQETSAAVPVRIAAGRLIRSNKANACV